MVTTKSELIKSAVLFEGEVLRLGLPVCRERLEKFEKKYKMKTETFLRKFEKGMLGDKPEWFDWLFEYKAYKHLRERLGAIRQIA